MGLLNAPDTQTGATGESFKNWLKKYLLAYPGLKFNEIDFWAACCAVLHTFTSESDLFKKGKARQIQYYTGPKESEIALTFMAETKSIDNGKHIPAHIEDTYLVFLEALRRFPSDLHQNCNNNSAYVARLNKLLPLTTG